MSTPETSTGDYDIHAKDVRREAECFWARLREAPGLARGERYGGFWFAAKYQDMKEA